MPEPGYRKRDGVEKSPNNRIERSLRVHGSWGSRHGKDSVLWHQEGVFLSSTSSVCLELCLKTGLCTFSS